MPRPPRKPGVPRYPRSKAKNPRKAPQRLLADDDSRFRRLLAEGYGRRCAKQIRLGNPNNAEHLAEVAGHHALGVSRDRNRRYKGLYWESSCSHEELL